MTISTVRVSAGHRPAFRLLLLSFDLSGLNLTVPVQSSDIWIVLVYIEGTLIKSTFWMGGNLMKIVVRAMNP